MSALVIQLENTYLEYPICNIGNGKNMLINKQDYLRQAKALIDMAPNFARMTEMQYKNYINEFHCDNNKQESKQRLQGSISSEGKYTEYETTLKQRESNALKSSLKTSNLPTSYKSAYQSVDGLNKDKKEFIKSSSKVSFKVKDTLEEYVKQSVRYFI